MLFGVSFSVLIKRWRTGIASLLKHKSEALFNTATGLERKRCNKNLFHLRDLHIQKSNVVFES